MSPEELERRLQGVNPSLANIARQVYQESGGKIGVTSHGGFRDRAQQAKMYDDYRNGGNLAARPGNSMHERGLAIDFDTDDYDLLASIATRLGLVNSVNGEPWHYTMGDGVEVDETPTLPYDVGETENPEDALANRLNAVLSMMGGASPAGVEPVTQNDMGAEPDPIAGVSEEAATAGGAARGAVAGASQLQQYALSQFSQFGWGQEELNSLIELWNRESNWNPQADNPTSSAAGIAQKMTSIHGAIEPTGEGQINWGLQYIMGRYGSPSRALQFHNQNNWY